MAPARPPRPSNAKFAASLASADAPERYHVASRVYATARRALELNLGGPCQSRCVFCVEHPAPADQSAGTPAKLRFLPFQAVQGELEGGRRRGCDSLGLLGGEPTLYPELGGLLAVARSLGYARIAVSTNGLRLADAAFAHELADAGVTRYTVSFHSHREDLEDSLCGVTGAFARKRAALCNLVALRAAGRLPDNVSVNAVVMRPNLPYLTHMVRFFDSLGVDDVRFNSLRPEGRAGARPELLPPLHEITPRLLALVEAHQRRPRGTITFGDFPHCVLPWPVLTNPLLFRAHVGEHRDLVTDVATGTTFPDAPAEASRFNWQDAKANDLKTKPAACARCRRARDCEGVWRAYLDIHGAADLCPIRA